MNCAVSVFTPAVQGDVELIQQVVLFSDHRAFAELMCRYQSGVKRLLIRFNKLDGVTMDDLVQETFTRAFLSIASFNHQAKFSTWLYRIAFNLAVDYSRKKTIDKCALELAEHIAEYPILNWELKTDLQKAMELLSSSQKIAIQLCITEGYSHVEAAEKMGIPLGTVKTHVSRAKKILQQEMIHWQFAA